MEDCCENCEGSDTRMELSHCVLTSCPCHKNKYNDPNYESDFDRFIKEHPLEEPESWSKEFVKKFHVYNLETNSPAGAEKEAVAFVAKLLEQERKNERDRLEVYECGHYEKGRAAALQEVKEIVEKIDDSGGGSGRRIKIQLLELLTRLSETK